MIILHNDLPVSKIKNITRFGQGAGVNVAEHLAEAFLWYMTFTSVEITITSIVVIIALIMFNILLLLGFIHSLFIIKTCTNNSAQIMLTDDLITLKLKSGTYELKKGFCNTKNWKLTISDDYIILLLNSQTFYCKNILTKEQQEKLTNIIESFKNSNYFDNKEINKQNLPSINFSNSFKIHHNYLTLFIAKAFPKLKHIYFFSILITIVNFLFFKTILTYFFLLIVFKIHVIILVIILLEKKNYEKTFEPLTAYKLLVDMDSSQFYTLNRNKIEYKIPFNWITGIFQNDTNYIITSVNSSQVIVSKKGMEEVIDKLNVKITNI